MRRFGVVPGGVGRSLKPETLRTLEARLRYHEIAESGSFAEKLEIANRAAALATGGRARAVTVEEVIQKLSSSTTTFQEARHWLAAGRRTFLGSRVDRLAPGSTDLVIRGSRSGHFLAREAAEHELLHVAQYLRTPGIRDTGVVKYVHEIVPALVGSPVTYIGGLGVLGGGAAVVRDHIAPEGQR